MQMGMDFTTKPRVTATVTVPDGYVIYTKGEQHQTLTFDRRMAMAKVTVIGEKQAIFWFHMDFDNRIHAKPYDINKSTPTDWMRFDDADAMVAAMLARHKLLRA